MIDVPGLDFGLLLPIFVLLLATLFMTAVYLVQRQAKAFTVSGMRFFLLLVIDGAMLGEIYLGSMLPQASLIFCLAIILTIQMDFECGYVVGNLALLALLPLRLASTAALLPIFLGLPVVVYMADRMKRTNGTATLIFLSALSPFVSALLYGLVLHDAVSMSGQNAIIVGISGGLSAILAIGLQPILELITDSVSASRLIRLSQPSQALLRRLFLEAPGTYQHSMMVANLAEKAAETVGADTLLVRVGTYYHDIGKMAHPDVFTENQTDYNPHQFLRPEESVKLILGHVDLGVRTARRFRLPERLQDFIREHHGNTLQASFYAKACENAQREGRPLPKESDFRYPGPMPRSKETAIVMLADSLEAAIRSTKTTTIQGAEEIARKIVRIKTEQDQLVNSGLSYYEVEQIIQAFVKVYRGQFHERVAYPEVPKPKSEILVTAEAKEEEQEAEKPEPVVDAGKETPVSAPAGGDELRPGRGV